MHDNLACYIHDALKLTEGLSESEINEHLTNITIDYQGCQQNKSGNVMMTLLTQCIFHDTLDWLMCEIITKVNK